MTGLGREVDLFHYGSVRSLEPLEAAVIELAGFTHQGIRIKGPSAESNCHGWGFTGLRPRSMENWDDFVGKGEIYRL